MAAEDPLTRAASALAQIRAEVTEPHMSIVQALSNYGSEQIVAGQIQQGLQTLRQAREMLKLCPVGQNEDKKMHVATEVSLINAQAAGHGLLKETAQETELLQSGLALLSEPNIVYKDLQVGQLQVLAMSYTNAENFELAFSHVGRALELADQQGMHELQLPLLTSLASINRRAGNREEAVSGFQLVASVLVQMGPSDDVLSLLTECTDQLVDLAVEMQDDALMKTYLDLAGSCWVRLNGIENARGAFYSEMQGRVAFEQGDIQRALGLAKIAVAVLSKLTVQPDSQCVSAMTLLSDVYLHIGKYQKAITFYQSVLAMLQALNGDYAGEMAAPVHCSLANAYRGVQDLESSAKHLELSKEILTRLHGNAPNWQRVQNLQMTGAAYKDQGDFPRAIASFQQALDMAKRLDMIVPTSKSTMLQDLGSAHLAMGNADTALELFLEAKAALVEGGIADDSFFTAELSMSLAAVYEELNRDSEAKALCLQALAIYKTLLKDPDDPSQQSGAPHPSVVAALILCGNLHAKLGEYLEAKAALDEALEAEKDGTPGAKCGILFGLYSMHELLGDVAGTMGCFQQIEGHITAMSDGSDEKKITTIFFLRCKASVLKGLGRFNEAKQLLDKMIAVANDEEDEGIRMGALHILIGVEHGLGNYPQALEHLELVIASMNKSYDGKPNLEMPQAWLAEALVRADMGDDTEKPLVLLQQARDMTLACLENGVNPAMFAIESSRAGALAKLGRLDEAKAAVDAAQAICDALPAKSGCMQAEVMLQRGKICQAEQNLLLAVETLQRAVELIPPEYQTSPTFLVRNALLALGDCQDAAGQRSLAEATWRRLASLLEQESATHPLLLILQSKLSHSSSSSSSSSSPANAKAAPSSSNSNAASSSSASAQANAGSSRSPASGNAANGAASSSS